MAAIDRVVHHSVILDMMAVESSRALEANHRQQPISEAAQESEAIVVAGGTSTTAALK
jgi:hypothetical protein